MNGLSVSRETDGRRARGPVGERFTLREVADLAGLDVRQVRNLTRRGIVQPDAPEGGTGYTFKDVVLLRATQRLSERFPTRRVFRSLRELRGQLGERSLAEVAIAPLGDEIVATQGERSWVPASGQFVLDLDASDDVSVEPTPLRTKAERAAQAEAASRYEEAYDLEPSDPVAAADRYREALALDAEHLDARLNLGRLLHERGELREAAECYEAVLTRDPDSVLAWFNLGVLYEQSGHLDGARAAYDAAILSDPAFADAHHNAANLAERQGRPADAVRHLRVLRDLRRPSGPRG